MNWPQDQSCRSAKRLLVTHVHRRASITRSGIAASRLLAPASAPQELIWAIVIGLILLYFSAGYALGGRWADRNPNPAVLYTALAIAGLTIAIIPVAARRC